MEPLEFVAAGLLEISNCAVCMLSIHRSESYIQQIMAEIKFCCDFQVLIVLRVAEPSQNAVVVTLMSQLFLGGNC